MPGLRFGYQGEKLSQARSTLMLPHELGEEQSLADAFDFCTRGLDDLGDQEIGDDNAADWIATIRRLMSTEGVHDPAGEGTWIQRARQMSVDERREFSNAVDELASWFECEFWSNSK
jgi:hypothetical protein